MPSTSPSRWKRLTEIALWTLLAALGISNLLLIRQNLQLRGELSQFSPASAQVGDSVSSFSAPDLHGAEVTVNYTGAGPKRVLLYFTPGCPYCREQFADWQKLIEQADAQRFEVLGVVNEEENRQQVETYISSFASPRSQKPLRVAFIPESVRRSYKLSATPITLVIASDGNVEQVWNGRWSAADAAQAAATFGINFLQP